MATRQKPTRRYWALHVDGLENGSFFRMSVHGIGQFINGDFMGMLPEVPKTYANQELIEFPREIAEAHIPACCK